MLQISIGSLCGCDDNKRGGDTAPMADEESGTTLSTIMAKMNDTTKIIPSGRAQIQMHLIGGQMQLT